MPICIVLLRRSGRAECLYSTMHSSPNSTDYSITLGFSPHILFRGFLLPTPSQMKHNTLRLALRTVISPFSTDILVWAFAIQRASFGYSGPLDYGELIPKLV